MRVGFAAAIIGAFAVTGSISLAPPSHADEAATFGEQNWQVICNYVGQEPTPHGIWAANSVLLTQQPYGYEQLDYGQMQDAIGYAIQRHCAQYSSIYSAYRSSY